MTAPTYAFAELAPWELGAEIPFPSSAVTALRNNAENLRERIGGDRFTEEQDHDHKGTNSAHPDPWYSDNLLVNANPGALTLPILGGSLDLQFWERSHDGITSNTSGQGVLLPGLEGQCFWQRFLFGADDDRNMNLLGRRNGLKLTCSLFVKAVDDQEEGLIKFGFVEGDSAELLPGCELQVDYTDLSTTWKRFWGTCTLPAIGSVEPEEAPLRFIVRCARTLTTGCYFGGFMAQITKQLQPFRFGNIGGYYIDDYAGLAYNVPVWDYTIAYTNAVKLTAV